jgi:hypothetical protein
MHKNRLITASALVSLALAGCGGGDSNKKLSYSAFGKKADTICQDAEDQNKALGKTTTNEATSENGELIGKLVGIVQKQRDKIADLKAPEQLKASQDEFVSLTDQQIELAKTAQTAANAQDQPGYESAITKLQALSSEANAAGSKLGAAACAS